MNILNDGNYTKQEGNSLKLRNSEFSSGPAVQP